MSSNTKLPVGMWYMLISATGFALMASSVKQVSTMGIPVLEIVAARALVSLILSYLDIKRKRIPVWGKNRMLLLARGVAGVSALICVYSAVTILPLAEANILQHLHPVFTVLLAMCFLQERIQKSTIICILLCLSGLVVTVKPGLFAAQTELPLYGVILGLAGAMMSAAAYIIVKKLSRLEDGSVIVFYFPLVALPVSVFLLGSDFVMPGPEALMLLLSVGIFTQIGQIFLTKAMQVEAASKVTAYSYVQVVIAIILGWLFFGEMPSLWTLTGGAMIIAGALINLSGGITVGKQQAESKTHTAENHS